MVCHTSYGKRSKAISLILTFLLLIKINTVSAEVTPIVPQDSTEEVTWEEVKNIFLGRQEEWSNRQAVVLVLLDMQSPQHRVFVEEYLRLLPTKYAREMERKISSGKITTPILVESSLDMISAVAANANSIGYLGDYIVLYTDSGVKRLEVQ